MATNELVRNELVCFLQQKSTILPFDDLIQIATDFYSSDEIKGAVTAVYNYVDQRPPAFKGIDKDRKFVADILKVILNPNVELPTFAALDISRLPPVSVDHMDTSALLQELALLRTEVRAIGALRSELEEMKAAVKTLQQSSFPTLQQGISTGHQNLPSISTTGVSQDDTASYNPSAAQRLKTAIQTGNIQRVNKPAKAKIVVGKLSCDKVKPVTTYRNIDLFISRVHPLHADTMITECARDALQMSCTSEKCQDAKIVSEKLVTKYDFYSSYHVTVTVDSVIFRDAIDGLMSSEVWPSGLLVRRFFHKKKNNGDGDGEQ